MRKSKLNLVTLLKSRLSEFPVIVNSLEKREVLFLEKLFFWIKNCEEIFSTNNISEVSELSGLRSKVIAVKFIEDKGTSLRKLQLRIASEILYDVQKTVLQVVKPLEMKIDECRELIIQLLLIASETGTIQYDSSKPFEKLINDVWQFIITSDQLKAGSIKLKTVLPITDIHILLAQEINLEDF